jgi:hypothetical protein
VNLVEGLLDHSVVDPDKYLKTSNEASKVRKQGKARFEIAIEYDLKSVLVYLSGYRHVPPAATTEETQISLSTVFGISKPPIGE